MKQFIPVAKNPIHGSLAIPGSKSITNRALLLASFAEGKSQLTNMLFSDDTLAFIGGLEALGVKIQINRESHSCVVEGQQDFFPVKKASIWCNASGTTLRFLLPACAASLGEYILNGAEGLKERPIHSLINLLTQQCAVFSSSNAGKMPFTLVANQLHGGEIEIDNLETSQFISGLLMSAPFAKNPMSLKPTQNLNNPYVKMTCQMMADFGVNVNFKNGVYSVGTSQRYQPRDYYIEPDLSTASYFFAAAAITNGNVMLEGINSSKTCQGDIQFLSVLEKMGCEIFRNENNIALKGTNNLNGIEVDMRDFSDTFPTLAAIAPFANSPTTIKNIAHTRLQESNRIASMRKNLEVLKIKVEEGPDWIRIFPGKPEGACVSSFNDHRIAMACSLIGLRIPGVIIQDAECVSKTCPEFFTMLDGL